MAKKRRVNLWVEAQRAGAKSATDFLLFEHLHEQRKAMRADSRKDGTDDVARNMARIYDIVLKYGCFFEPSPRPKKYKPGDRHQCYGNSLDLVIADEELSYWEGYVAVKGVPIPMEHAWCVTDEASVVDVTLRKPLIPLAYFGVEFNALFVATRDLPAIESVLIENAEQAIWRPFPSTG